MEDDTGRTAPMIAEQCNFKEAIAFFLEKNDSCNVLNGKTDGTMQPLKSTTNPTTQKDNNDWTPLMWATHWWSEDFEMPEEDVEVRLKTIESMLRGRVDDSD
jgi:hypothetical protein